MSAAASASQPPSKLDVARALLDTASMFIHLDSRRSGVLAPESHMHKAQLVFQVGWNMAIPIPDLKVDEAGVTCTLQFRGQPFFCRIPWPAVYALVGEDGRGYIWPESVPPDVDLKKSAAPARGLAPPAADAGPLQPYIIVSEDPGEAISQELRGWAQTIEAALSDGHAPRQSLIEAEIRGARITFALLRVDGRPRLSARLGVDTADRGAPVGSSVFRSAALSRVPRVTFRSRTKLERLRMRLGLYPKPEWIDPDFDRRVAIESQAPAEDVRRLLSDTVVLTSIQLLFDELGFDRVGVRSEESLLVASRTGPTPDHAQAERLWRAGALLELIAHSAATMSF